MNRQKRSRKIFRFREDILRNMCPRSQRLRWHGSFAFSSFMDPTLCYGPWTLSYVMVPKLSPMLWSLDLLLCYGPSPDPLLYYVPEPSPLLWSLNPLLCYGPWTLLFCRWFALHYLPLLVFSCFYSGKERELFCFYLSHARSEGSSKPNTSLYEECRAGHGDSCLASRDNDHATTY